MFPVFPALAKTSLAVRNVMNPYIASRSKFYWGEVV